MENLKQLEQFIGQLGFFSQTINLKILIEREFEGFYNKASEDWEQRVTIEIESPNETICPNVKVVGKRFEKINDVAARVLETIYREQISDL